MTSFSYSDLVSVNSPALSTMVPSETFSCAAAPCHPDRPAAISRNIPRVRVILLPIVKNGPPAYCWRSIVVQIPDESIAAVKLITRDASMPIEHSVSRQILADVPECAIVGRVDLHRGVIAPTCQRSGPIERLRASPRNQGGLRLHL